MNSFWSTLVFRDRSTRALERQAHWRSAGDRSSFSGASAEDQSSRLSSALRQSPAEDDGSTAAGGQSCSVGSAAEWDGGRLVLTPPSAGDYKRLVLMCGLLIVILSFGLPLWCGGDVFALFQTFVDGETRTERCLFVSERFVIRFWLVVWCPLQGPY